MMMSVDVQYAQLVQRILDYGEQRHDRTGVGTISVFDHRMEFDLRLSFPVLALKETRWKVAFLEMLWFLRGEQHTKYLHDHGCKLWDAWASEYGYLGPVYGWQWRYWWDDNTGEHTDQVRNLIEGLKNNPHGRRHIVTAWNVADLSEMALPPCHWAHQCYVTNDGHLNLKLFLRSSDVFLGLPFNIAQYALLTHLYARAAGLMPGRLIVDLGDAHLYMNHLDGAREVMRRYASMAPQRPQLDILTDNIDIDGYKPDDFAIRLYNPRPFIKGEVAV